VAGDVYRDASVRLVLRVQELWRDVQEREARLSRPDLLAALPAPLDAQLAEMAAAVAPPAVTPDELTTRALALVGYRDLLDAAIRAATLREPSSRRVPDSAPELTWASIGGLPFLDLSKLQPHADDLQRSFELALSAFGAVTFGMEDGACHSRFTWQGTPVSALAAYAQSPEGVLVTRVALATRVMPDLPHLHVRGRRSSDGAGHDATSRFDTLFVCDGDPAAHALVTEEVRQRLVTIARRDAPILWAQDGEARLTWSWDPDAAMFDAAVRALHAIRVTVAPRRRG
jgi:hypothetical protein